MKQPDNKSATHHLITHHLIPESIRLLNSSGYQHLEDVKTGTILAGETAVIRVVHAGQMLAAYLIGQRDNYRNLSQDTINLFAEKLKATFNNEELKTLCSELAIPFDDLAADTQSGYVRQLVSYGRRHGRLADMVNYCRHHRPREIWPDFPITSTPTMVVKNNLAVVISINQMALQSAAAYLAQEGINADYLLITPVPNYTQSRFLPDDQDWGPAVQDFFQTMQPGALKLPPGIRRHFFFAAPLPYTFAIGCAWGLVHQGDKLYHWNGSEYILVMTVSRNWKNPS
jgi:hypothetical protein